MSPRLDDRRFFILLGVVFVFVVALTLAARFLGSVLWQDESPVAGFRDDPPLSPPLSGASQSADAPPPKAPPVRVSVDGSIPPEWMGLESRLAGMEQALTIRRTEHRALREKVAMADALILQAEGDAPETAPDLSLPLDRFGKREGPGIDQTPAADVTRLRQRLETLGQEGIAPIRGNTP